MFSDGDLRIRVEDQVAEGHNRGRPIKIWGIVISRWRTLLLGIGSLRGTRAHRRQR